MKFSLFVLIVVALASSTLATSDVMQKKGLVIDWTQVITESINAANQLGIFPGELATERNIIKKIL